MGNMNLAAVTVAAGLSVFLLAHTAPKKVQQKSYYPVPRDMVISSACDREYLDSLYKK